VTVSPSATATIVPKSSAALALTERASRKKLMYVTRRTIAASLGRDYPARWKKVQADGASALRFVRAWLALYPARTTTNEEITK
jgi:hypothetical protein